MLYARIPDFELGARWALDSARSFVDPVALGSCIAALHGRLEQIPWVSRDQNKAVSHVGAYLLDYIATGVTRALKQKSNAAKKGYEAVSNWAWDLVSSMVLGGELGTAVDASLASIGSTNERKKCEAHGDYRARRSPVLDRRDG